MDPNGTATSYRFEYGTTTAYGLQTADKPAGEGADPVPASAPLEGLTPNTTYHFRIVATSGAGTTNGEDKTFRTTADPTPPGADDRLRPLGRPAERAAARDGRPEPGRDRLALRVRHHDRLRLAHPEPQRGRRRPPRLEQRHRERPEAVHRYHYRLVATNAAGTTHSRDRSFVTQRLPTGITLSLPSGRVPWGEGLEVTGDVQGSGVGGITVALERQDFPFGGPFSTEGTPAPVRADRSGRFRFFLPSLFTATRLHALTRSPIAVTSADVAPQVAVRVGAGTRRVSKRRVRVRGAVRPAVPSGRAVLQRRTASGGWVFARGRGPSPSWAATGRATRSASSGAGARGCTGCACSRATAART